MRICIVGRGILGLSIAEYFSRTSANTVEVISCSAHSAASAAAAANLATKAQVFARDRHFELKIRGKSLYSDWLVRMRRECEDTNPEDLSDIYRMGWGRDFFPDDNSCTVQWRRVQQPAHEIQARGLQPQVIRRLSPTCLEYADEAWVDAQYLLDLLGKVCSKRGVRFSEADVLNKVEGVFQASSFDHLILAAGGNTPQILAAWGARGAEDVFKKSRRWSFGATLEVLNSDWQMPEGVSLLEVLPSSGPLSKLTFSGVSGRLFCSSLSVKCPDNGFARLPDEADAALVEQQKQKMVELACETFALKPEKSSLRFRFGLRLGFGHTELVCESLPVPDGLSNVIRHSLIVASGAHKSGFLFAPCMGELVLQKMQAL
jgi:hypothetical protein